MPDEDNNFGGSLVLDFTNWWRHVQPKNIYVCQFVHVFLFSTQFSSDQIQNGGVNSDGRLPF